MPRASSFPARALCRCGRCRATQRARHADRRPRATRTGRARRFPHGRDLRADRARHTHRRTSRDHPRCDGPRRRVRNIHHALSRIVLLAAGNRRRGRTTPRNAPMGMLVDVYLRPRSRALQPFSRKVTRLTQAVGRSEPHRPTASLHSRARLEARARNLHSGKVTWVAWMYLRFRPARSCSLRARMGAPPTAAGGVAMSSRKKERKRGRPT